MPSLVSTDFIQIFVQKKKKLSNQHVHKDHLVLGLVPVPALLQQQQQEEALVLHHLKVRERNHVQIHQLNRYF